MNNKTRLAERLEDLAQVRASLAGVKLEITDLEREIGLSKLGLGLQSAKEALANLRETEAEAAISVRQSALTVQRSGQELPQAIKVKQYTVLAYDQDDALTYAREHLPGAVKLDVRAFEKAAKAIELEFVTVSKEPRVTIARDLSEYLTA